MAVQRITIAKLGGAAGKMAIGAIKRWASFRPKLVDLWESWHWQPVVERKVLRFVNALDAHATSPEMLYFAELIDQWSVGPELFDTYLQPIGGRVPYVISTDNDLLVASYRLPDGNALKRSLASSLHRKRLRVGAVQQEHRWFALNLLEAVRAWDALIPSAALVLVRQVFAGSPDDKAVAAACASSPGWLRMVAGARGRLR